MATENLFLLEFLVDKICLQPNVTQDVKYSGMCQENCVTFCFLDNGPLDVCETDFTPKRDYTQGGTFKSGKSILFSLTPQQAEKAVKDFTIHVVVYKKLPNNKMPDRIPIGGTAIQIVNQFCELLDQISTCPKQVTAAKTIKDSFTLTDCSGTCVGSICVFIRISCFGKLIVTQFQMNLDDKSVVFKDNQGSSMYRYRKSQKDKKDVCEEWERAIAGKLTTPSSCTSPPDPCSPVSNTNSPSPLPNCPPPIPDDRCYQEIGAEMNGNALTIRVLKDKKKNKNETNDMTNDACCCEQQKTGAGECGDSPVITALPEGPNPPQLNFKVNSCCGGNQDLKINGPKQTGPLQVTEMCDPHRDVFVLRIGKKAEGAEKKSNLELELRTPKGLDRKPPAKFESRDTQYDEKDCGPPGTGTKKGVGKKKRKMR